VVSARSCSHPRYRSQPTRVWGLPDRVVPPSRRPLALEHLFDQTEGHGPATRGRAPRPSIAMLAPGARDAIGREDALGLVTELHNVQGRLHALKRRLREPAEEP